MPGSEPGESDGSDDEAQESLYGEPEALSNEEEQSSVDDSSEHADDDSEEDTNHNLDEAASDESDDDLDYVPNEETDNESSESSEELLSPSGASQLAASDPSQPPPTFTCAICLDPPEFYNNHTPTARCTHTPTICTLCLEQHISHAVLTDGSTTVPCPEPECGETLEYDDVIRGARNDESCLAR